MDHGYMTPNFEVMEGMRFGQYHPAPYLPIVRNEKHFEDQIVIGAGKAVALDSDCWLVPAGLKKHLAAGAGNGPQYTQLDIDMGILDAEGNVPALNDYVVDAMLNAGTTVGHCAGAASYNVYLLSGDDPSNPATYRFHNYSRQNGVAVLTDYLLEFPKEPLKRTAHEMALITTIAGAPGTLANPYQVDLDHNSVVEHQVSILLNNERVHADDWTFQDNAGGGGVDRLEFSDSFRSSLVEGDEIQISYLFEEAFYDTPWAGMATWKGACKCGDKVTYDADSNWVAYAPLAVGDTSAGDESANVLAAIAETLEVVGQVTKVDVNFPKQFLDRVKTAFDPRLTGTIVDGETGKELNLDRHPGSANDGVPHNVYFAGGDLKTGVVRFNLNVT
jgi:hypothetical protein